MIISEFHFLYWEVSGACEVHVACTLYSWTPDYQGFSFAVTCLFLPLVVRFLGRIWDYNGFWGYLQGIGAWN